MDQGHNISLKKIEGKKNTQQGANSYNAHILGHKIQLLNTRITQK